MGDHDAPTVLGSRVVSERHMDTRRACLVDAFTDEPLSGNAAGVIPDADGLSTAQMQAIAAELAASETAFVRSSPDADRQVEFFTPTQPVDLCGHATVASHALLYEDGEIDAGEHTIETTVGVLDIELIEDGTVWMTQSRPEVEPVEVDDERIAAALGVDVATLRDVGAELPFARATTGLPFLIIPINFLSSLSSVDPDFDAIASLSAEFDVTGVYVFTFDTLSAESTFHARMFAPAAGVNEDPVTGTASGACAAYLDESEAFDSPPEEFVIEQGHFIDRPGRVRARVTTDDRGRKTVRVGGRAVTALDGRLVVPDDDDDEILEL